MPARKPRHPDEKPQIEEFIETARKLGADESREAFERAFRRVVKTGGPMPTPSAPHPRRSGKRDGS